MNVKIEARALIICNFCPAHGGAIYVRFGLMCVCVRSICGVCIGQRERIGHRAKWWVYTAAVAGCNSGARFVLSVIVGRV